jgi:hypothetical protein
VHIQVYNNIGMLIRELNNIEVNGDAEVILDLRPVAPGVYTVVIRNGSMHVIKKMIVSR